jgi:hypothetical protein
LQLNAFRSFVQHPLGALALLQDLLNGGLGPHFNPDRGVQSQRELVERRDIGGIGGHYHQLAVFPPGGKKGVTKHQLHRDAAEDLGIGLKLAKIDEGKTAPAGQLASLLFLLGNHPDGGRTHNRRRRNHLPQHLRHAQSSLLDYSGERPRLGFEAATPPLSAIC